MRRRMWQTRRSIACRLKKQACSLRQASTISRSSTMSIPRQRTQMTDIPELTAGQLARAMSARARKRLMNGQFQSGEDIAMLRKFVGLTQAEFAKAIGISVHTLR